MRRIWNTIDQRWENVRCLKNLSFEEQPGKKFFLHRSLKCNGFTVSELQTGGSVCQGRASMQKAIEDAETLLGSVSKKAFQSMIDKALIQQEEEGLRPSPDPFPEDRTGEPEEFKEEDL